MLSFCKTEVKKYYINIEMEGKPFKVRTYECGSKANKTLVFVTGYLASALRHSCIFDELAKNYRVITFDHGCFGMNTRLESTNSADSNQDAEAWMADQFERVIGKLDLPPKFLLAAHC